MWTIQKRGKYWRVTHFGADGSLLDYMESPYRRRVKKWAKNYGATSFHKLPAIT
jgi:hypothetical protein